MPVYRLFVITALATLPLAANAQQHQINIPSAAAPARKDAAPAIAYQSSFKDYKTMTDEAETPDNAWIKANQEVAGIGEHGAHSSHGSHSAPSSPPNRKAATPSSSVPAADAHTGHHAHHGEGHER